MLRTTALTLLLMTVLSTTAAIAEEIYKTVDEDGKVIYTDSPKGKSEKVEMEELNTLPPPDYVPRHSSSSSEGTSPQDQQPNYQLYFSAPADGTQIGPGQLSLNVQVYLEPSLQDGHYLQFYVNGEAQGAPQTATGFVATNLLRGQKIISASVIDNQGKVLASAAPVTVYVIRPNPKSK